MRLKAILGSISCQEPNEQDGLNGFLSSVMNALLRLAVWPHKVTDLPSIAQLVERRTVEEIHGHP
ncbi:UNVERIFIED_CONTAM: hypothetical protein FKN15_045526 [Acipenser sinensis]